MSKFTAGLFLLSFSAFAEGACIDLAAAKHAAQQVSVEGLSVYERQDLIDWLAFDDSTKSYMSELIVSEWPGGEESVQLVVSCSGQATFAKFCSGDCD